MKAIHIVAFTLLLIGGVNWGLIGLFNFDLVKTIFGSITGLVQVLVGISAVILLFTHKKDCKACGAK